MFFGKLRKFAHSDQNLEALARLCVRVFFTHIRGTAKGGCATWPSPNPPRIGDLLGRRGFLSEMFHVKQVVQGSDLNKLY
jgi:hypothetical protein